MMLLRMLEIIFFAGIALYILSRLWNVLGTRGGFERPRAQEDTLANNVIVMPKRGRKSQGQTEEMEETHDQGPFAHQLKKIRAHEPGFELGDFEDKVCTAYTMIVESFHKGEPMVLQNLLSEKVFQQFDAAMKNRAKRGEVVENEFVGPVTCITDFVEVKTNQASIETKISSQQRLMTYDKDRVILDNRDESILRITEYWTFSRTLGSDDPTWKLTKTHTASSFS